MERQSVMDETRRGRSREVTPILLSCLTVLALLGTLAAVNVGPEGSGAARRSVPTAPALRTPKASRAWPTRPLATQPVGRRPEAASADAPLAERLAGQGAATPLPLLGPLRPAPAPLTPSQLTLVLERGVAIDAHRLLDATWRRPAPLAGHYVRRFPIAPLAERPLAAAATPRLDVAPRATPSRPISVVMLLPREPRLTADRDRLLAVRRARRPMALPLAAAIRRGGVAIGGGVTRVARALDGVAGRLGAVGDGRRRWLLAAGGGADARHEAAGDPVQRTGHAGHATADRHAAAADRGRQREGHR
ncbi:MAG: hypothetical protein AAF790_08210, partial [Planctomycetota bacterium]